MKYISVIKRLYSLFTLSFYNSKSFPQYLIFRNIFAFVCKIFKNGIITVCSMLIISAVNIVGGSYISIFLVLINININNVYRSSGGTLVPLGLKPCHFNKPPFFQCGNISRRSFASKVAFIFIFFCFVEDIFLILPISHFHAM